MGVAAMPVGRHPLPGLPLRLHRRGRVRDFRARRAGRGAGATLLLEQPEVAPAGLGARDSLRLEAGLCLYGNDIDELTTPVEAGLTWAIGKRRKLAWDFPGAAVIRDQLDNGAAAAARRHPPGRPRAGPRAAPTIVAADGTEAGDVTSGGFSPTLNAPIAMGYVRRDLAADGTTLSPDGARQAAARHRRAAAVRPPPLRPLKGARPMARQDSDTRYTKDHEWVRLDGDIATVGITDHAQEQLGDLVFVELPELDREVAAGEACAVVESVKAASRHLRAAGRQGGRDQRDDRRGPGAGEQRRRGRRLVLPAGIDDPDAFEALMDEDAYDEFLETL